MFVPGVEDDGVGGIEIAIGLGPREGFAEMRGDFIGRGGGGVDERLLLLGWCENCALACPRASLYNLLMTFTQRIPAERLLGLDVHEGDTLHVIAVLDSSFVVQVSRAEEPAPVRGKASEWLESARGSVKLAPGETVDDVRMGYYASKYGIAS